MRITELLRGGADPLFGIASDRLDEALAPMEVPALEALRDSLAHEHADVTSAFDELEQKMRRARDEADQAGQPYDPNSPEAHRLASYIVSKWGAPDKLRAYVARNAAEASRTVGIRLTAVLTALEKHYSNGTPRPKGQQAALEAAGKAEAEFLRLEDELREKRKVYNRAGAFLREQLEPELARMAAAVDEAGKRREAALREARRFSAVRT